MRRRYVAAEIAAARLIAGFANKQKAMNFSRDGELCEASRR
jgi:hypothetical protein